MPGAAGENLFGWIGYREPAPAQGHETLSTGIGENITLIAFDSHHPSPY
jgi:hypothetical protein